MRQSQKGGAFIQSGVFIRQNMVTFLKKPVFQSPAKIMNIFSAFCVKIAQASQVQCILMSQLSQVTKFVVNFQQFCYKRSNFSDRSNQHIYKYISS